MPLKFIFSAILVLFLAGQANAESFIIEKRSTVKVTPFSIPEVSAIEIEDEEITEEFQSSINSVFQAYMIVALQEAGIHGIKADSSKPAFRKEVEPSLTEKSLEDDTVEKVEKAEPSTEISKDEKSENGKVEKTDNPEEMARNGSVKEEKLLETEPLQVSEKIEEKEATEQAAQKVIIEQKQADTPQIAEVQEAPPADQLEKAVPKEPLNKFTSEEALKQEDNSADYILTGNIARLYVHEGSPVLIGNSSRKRIEGSGLCSFQLRDAKSGEIIFSGSATGSDARIVKTNVPTEEIIDENLQKTMRAMAADLVAQLTGKERSKNKMNEDDYYRDTPSKRLKNSNK